MPAPGSPGGPSDPSVPGDPAAPSAPRAPGCPAGPGVPAIPNEETKVYNSVLMSSTLTCSCIWPGPGYPVFEPERMSIPLPDTKYGFPLFVLSMLPLISPPLCPDALETTMLPSEFRFTVKIDFFCSFFEYPDILVLYYPKRRIQLSLIKWVFPVPCGPIIKEW